MEESRHTAVLVESEEGNGEEKIVMSLLGNVLGTVIDMARLPISVVKDVATLGGVLTDRSHSYTRDVCGNLREDLNELDEELRDL